MALRNYILNGPKTVILYDNRDPAVSWQHHLDRTSGLRGGVDLVAAIGTPIYAPTNGTVHWYKNLGSAGNTIYFAHDDNPGWQDVFSHLSAFAGSDGRWFRQGQLIGWTGNTGGVAQHLHRHLLDPSNTRRNPWLYFNNLSTAGGAPVPVVLIPKDIQESFQIVLKFWNDPLTGKPFYTGPTDGAFGTASWTALQRYMQTQGAYTGPADGIPGGRTYKGLQILAQRGGYTGLLDGIPGGNTYIGLRDWLRRAVATTIPNAPTPTPTPTPKPTVPAAPAGKIFGIDIGTSQAAIDLEAFAAAGGKFAIIKMGGGNASDSPYTAPKYQVQLNAARIAGLPVAHYWFNGQKITVAAQARYFIDNVDLRGGEVVALDVEAEAASGTRAFTPAEVLEFITLVEAELPGIQFLIYMSASVTRNADWSAVVATGAGLWVASYGANDGKVGDAPTIAGWADWAIWQYTSTGGVPGFDGNIDHNFAIDNLFKVYGYVAQPVQPAPSELPDFIAALRTLIAQYE